MQTPIDFFFLFVSWLQTSGLINIVILVTAWIILIIANGVTTRILRHRAMKAGVPPDAVNGLVLAIRLIFLYIAISALFIILPPAVSGLLLGAFGGASLLIGTAVGFAVGQAVRNLVSGLYVMFSRPFHVGDYVRIGTVEGIVQEISLNYTKLLQPDETSLLVPNNTVLESSITNFWIAKKTLQPSGEEGESDRQGILTKVIQAFNTDKILRYVFSLAFHTSQKIKKLEAGLDQVCTRWHEHFGFKPIFEILDISQFAFTYQFSIFVDNPRKIIDCKAEFLKDLLHTIFD